MSRATTAPALFDSLLGCLVLVGVPLVLAAT
jgi:hypothetical protein